MNQDKYTVYSETMRVCLCEDECGHVNVNAWCIHVDVCLEKVCL